MPNSTGGITIIEVIRGAIKLNVVSIEYHCSNTNSAFTVEASHSIQLMRICFDKLLSKAQGYTKYADLMN